MGWCLVPLALAGCGLVHERGGAGVDGGGGGTTDVGGDFGQSESYVVSTIRIGDTGANGTDAFGLDLDGQIGGPPGRCTDQPDFRSPISGATGVDNQMVNLFLLIATMGTDEDSELRIALSSGALLLGIRVVDINSFAEDSSVDVHLALLDVASGEMLPIDASGAIAPGGHYVVREELGTFRGMITNGNLEVSTSAAPRLLPLLGSTPSLRVSRLTLRAHITATGLTSGELGGDVSVDDIVQTLTAAGLPVDRTTIEGVVPPDLDPDASGFSCGGLSTGASITAVLGEIAGL